MPNPTPRRMQRRGRLAAIGVGVVLLIGIASTMASLALGHPWTPHQVLYDVGLGAFTATAVSAILGLYLQSLERQEQARRDQQAAEWKRITDDVADLEAEYRRIESQLDFAKLENSVSGLALTVSNAQRDLLRRMKEVLTKVDPDYKDEIDIAIDRVWSEWVKDNSREPPSEPDRDSDRS